MNIFKYILLLSFIGLFTPINAKKSDKYAQESNKRKSKYVFLEAMHKKVLEEYDSYQELLQYAYDLDTTNTGIAHHLGYSMLISNGNSKDNIDKGVALMKKHFDSTPEDLYESFLYGNVCGKLRKNEEALRVWKKLAEIFPQKQEIKYRLADSYADNREFTKAIALYDSIEAIEEPSIQITLRKINLRLATNDSIGSIKEAQKLLNSAPDNVDFNLLLGNIYMQFAKNDSAMAYFDKAHEIDPSNGYVYLYKADYYKLMGDSINYDKQIYNALINKDIAVEQKLNVLTDYVTVELNAGVQQQSERIDNLFNVLIEQHPHESAIHDLYSQYLVTIKNYHDAAEQLGYVLDLEPTNAECWKKYMLINLMDENYDEAFRAADKALEYNPDNIDLYQYIAPAYYQTKQYNKAIEVYHLALEKADTLNVELMSNLVSGLGDVYFSMGDTIKAFAHYEMAIDYNPANVMAMNNYAYFLAESNKDLNKAERLSSLTIKYEPENPTYLDTYAWIFFKKGEYSLALSYIRSAIRYSEGQESAELLEHYGDILFMNGLHEEAIPQWERAYQLNPESGMLQKKVKHKTFFFK